MMSRQRKPATLEEVQKVVDEQLKKSKNFQQKLAKIQAQQARMMMRLARKTAALFPLLDNIDEWDQAAKEKMAAETAADPNVSDDSAMEQFVDVMFVDHEDPDDLAASLQRLWPYHPGGLEGRFAQ